MRFKSPGKTDTRRAAALVTVCALALLAAAACSLDSASKKRVDAAKSDAASETPRGSQPPQTSLPLPPVETAHRRPAGQLGGWTQLDGRRTSLADYRGQVVLLDMYATYCPPCLEETPHLVALQRRYARQGLNVVGLNVGGADDRAKVPGYVQRFGIQYQLANPDPELVEVLSAGDDSIPKTFVFDRQGRLVERFTGFDQTVALGLERAVQQALAGKAD